MEEIFSKKAKENQRLHGGTAPGKTLGQKSAQVMKTREELANIAGVSHDPVSKVEKITKSFRVEPKLWTEVKVHCAQHGIDLSSFLEDALREKLKKQK